MKTIRSLFKSIFYIGLTYSTFGLQAQEPEQKLKEDLLQPFLKKYCIDCHNEKKKKGKVRLDNLHFSLNNNDTAEHWQEILNVMNFMEMPPEDEPQPEFKEFENVLSHLSDSLFQARKRMTTKGGEVEMRKLNQREYRNTIQEMFGFWLNPDDIPVDDVHIGYDTQGSQQFFSDDHFKAYFKLSKRIIKDGLHWASQPRKHRHDYKSEREKDFIKRNQKFVDDLSAKWKKYKAGANYQELGIVDSQEFGYFKERTERRIRVRTDYLTQRKVDEGVYLSFHEAPWNTTLSLKIDPRATYTLNIHGGLKPNTPITRQFTRIECDGRVLGFPHIKGTIDQPQTSKIDYTPYLGKNVVNFDIKENRPENNLQAKSYLRHVDPELKGDPSRIWIDYLEINGPFYSETSFFEKLCYPEGLKRKNEPLTYNDANMHEFIKAFAQKAFRSKEIEGMYLHDLIKLYHYHRSQGLGIKDSLIEPLALVLASPSFLYLYESTKVGNDVFLSQQDFATRMSFFLWSSPPDAELLASAHKGNLYDTKVITQQVERMLKDPRSKNFTQNFMKQWSMLERFDHLNLPEKKSTYLEFNRGVKHFAKQEPIAFFEQMLKQNLAVSNLIDSDFVMSNRLLSHHYDMPLVESDEFIKVPIEPKSVRGGWISQTAFLSSGTSGERSSPIIRGAILLEKILHRQLPPPPADVPELGEVSKTPLSVRKSTELHKEQAQCSTCHSKMDPLGFALENFDVMGKWRTVERVGKKNQPIEVHGQLPTGENFKDLHEFKSSLLKHEDLLAASFFEGMLAYGLGREIEFSDGLILETMLKNLKNNGNGCRDMVHTVIQSSLFRKR